MSQKTKSKYSNWFWIDREDEILINLVCTHCGKTMKSKGILIYGNDKLGVVCDDCVDEFDKEGQFETVSIKEISKDTVKEILEKNQISLFIQGRNLYINFCLMVKNYRDKTEFCNY